MTILWLILELSELCTRLKEIDIFNDDDDRAPFRICSASNQSGCSGNDLIMSQTGDNALTDFCSQLLIYQSCELFSHPLLLKSTPLPIPVVFLPFQVKLQGERLRRGLNNFKIYFHGNLEWSLVSCWWYMIAIHKQEGEGRSMYGNWRLGIVSNLIIETTNYGTGNRISLEIPLCTLWMDAVKTGAQKRRVFNNSISIPATEVGSTKERHADK